VFEGLPLAAQHLELVILRAIRVFEPLDEDPKTNEEE
jgi:hypothetical protein